ncbi:right-handed parallel beta-helix repeat-containing protein [Paracoccus suum]|uniref:Right-handed parallel beta-helix repeat-containing protein n=1 Tax=Paracoccus suum TaxID=2259340 RepID=A0A344PL82_9RHOB|nr:glycosyl hydrolase family 28-related protein [Paracoccus suum]AXC50137.1 right-handed parallel beta-helix repeat-containing protein [Paracoccus suum]
MNIAITDGIQLSPPGFAAGLSVWSREDGTAGSATWANATNAAVVPADQDFGTCLEIFKQDDLTKLRFMAETPILPGTYLRISARVKAVAGMLPSVRIAAFAGNGARQRVTNLVDTGPAAALSGYGRIVEVSAIVGTGRRTGVNMAWGSAPIYGHFGLDLFGANGGSVRIESIRIEDVTSAFLRTMMDWVDVRDFGAVGDGVTDDRAAFAAADAAARGRQLVVPAGTFRIGSDLTINAPIRFQGKLVMPRTARLALVASFNFPTYAEAFGEETEGFKRALQALLGYTDHGTLDLCGRRVDLTGPIDLADAVPGVTNFSNRRVISNGQLCAVPGAAWNTGSVSSVATYNVGQSTLLTGVANVANIEVGSLVTGAGVGREVYVKERNIGAGTLTLSQPLFGGSGTRTYAFKRFRYIFDMSGMAKVDRLNFADIEFLCDGVASAVMLPPAGEMIHFRDCYVVRCRDRGITSIGRGCQDMLVDRCQFLSNEMDELWQNRTNVCINVNANDTKICENRFVRFRHFMVASGTGHLISGNHWFQGDAADPGVRGGGLVIANTTVQITVTANYIDNSSIEWTNEYAPQPTFNGAQWSFGGLVVTGNTFLCSHTVNYFSFIVVKPYGPGHFIQGLTVTSNVFLATDRNITRVDRVDTTYAALDNGWMRNITFDGNTYNGVDVWTSNPLLVEHSQATASTGWTVPTADRLPFNGWAKQADSIIATTAITDSGNARLNDMPYLQVRQASDQKSLKVNWSKAAKGSISVRVRMDNKN